MLKYINLYKLSNIIDGILIGKNIYVSNISIDTRKDNIKNSVFIVIKGNYDINFLCFDAIKKGAIALIVESFYNYNISQLLVKNTNIALGKIGLWLRKKSNAKFFCLTGSTGKTSVKEITSNIFKQFGKILYNYKNFNNDLGVPTTLLKLYNENYKYVILELGGNCIGDIKYLSSICLPNVSCITNISYSHLVGFKNFTNIIKDKINILKYLDNNGIIILNRCFLYNFFLNKYFLNKKILFYSFFKNKKSIVYIKKYKLYVNGSRIILSTIYGNINIFLKLLGFHNILNVLTSVALSLSVSNNLKDIKIGLESFNPIKRRLYPIFLKKNKLILDDTYNSNPRSLYFSLIFLNKCIGYKILVVSDMAELSYLSVYFHIKIGFFIKKFLNIDLVLSIGKYSYLLSKYSCIGKHFYNFNDLIFYIKKMLFIYDDITILIKGSNLFNMNKIIYFL